MGSTGAMVLNTDLKPDERSSQKPAPLIPLPLIAPLVTRNVGSRDDMLTDRILDNGTDDAIAPPDIEPADIEPALTFLTAFAFGAFPACPFLYSCHLAPAYFII